MIRERGAHSRLNESGATLVEAAFVLPLLFAVLITFVDFGDFIIQNSQAAAAARDGARYGIIYYTDTAGIVAAAGRHVTHVVSKPDNITITCATPNPTASSPAVNSVDCAKAVPGCDLMQVTINWPRTAFSPLGVVLAKSVSATSKSVIIGGPGQGSGTFDNSGGC